MFAYLSHDKAFFIRRPTLRQIKVHIEGSLINTDIDLLKKYIDDVIGQTHSFLKKNNNRPNEVKVEIYSGEHSLASGETMSRGKIAHRFFSEKIFEKLLFAGATFLVSYLLSLDLEAAGKNLLAIVIVATLWVLIQTLFLDRKVVYSE